MLRVHIVYQHSADTLVRSPPTDSIPLQLFINEPWGPVLAVYKPQMLNHIVFAPVFNNNQLGELWKINRELLYVMLIERPRQRIRSGDNLDLTCISEAGGEW